MKLPSLSATAPTAAAVCFAAAAGLGTVMATQGWLINRARRGLAMRRHVTIGPTTSADTCRRPARLLVVGDSTAVGVGSGTPAQSLHGRLQGEFDQTEIVNHARVGARVADVVEQLAPLRCEMERFDFALVLVGGNDIVQLTPLTRLAEDARSMLAALQPLARTVVWIGCADVGIAPCFIAPFTWMLSRRSRQAARRLGAAAREARVHFIDFVEHPLRADFRRRPGRYFAADGIHPSGFAYGRCYEVLRAHPGFAAFAAAQREATAERPG